MKKLVIIALVSIFATPAIAVPCSARSEGVQVQIPVIMDITPVASIDLNGSQIKLELCYTNNPCAIVYEGIADPPPILRSNVPVGVTATITPLRPIIEDAAPFVVALGNQVYTTAALEVTPLVIYKPLIGGSGVGIEITAAISNPDLTVRPVGLDAQVAVVTLTIIPVPAG